MTEPTLSTLREALLGGLRTTKPLDSSEGDLAYERHQLLALRLHRIVQLVRPPKANGREAWSAFFRAHFPHGDEHAELLRTAWRRPLLRNRPPGAGVLITFAAPGAHWSRADDGPLVLDLESLARDLELAVDSLLAGCAADPARALRVLRRFRRRPWTVEAFVQPRPDGYPLDHVAAATSTSASSLMRGGVSTEQPN